MGDGGAFGFGRRHTLLALCVLAMFLAYTDRVNIAVAAVAMRSEFHWNQSVKGLVLAAFFVGYMLFQIAGGALARRFGGKRVLAVAVAWWSTFTLLTPFAATVSVVALLGARVGLGLGEGVVMPAAYELFSRWVPPSERGRSIARFLGGIPIGQIVGFTASAWLTAEYGWPSSFYLFGALGLAWAGLWLVAVENDPADDARIGEAERRLLATCVSARAASAPTPWRAFVGRAPVWGLVAAHFCHNWILYVLLSWLPSYFSESHRIGIASAGAYAAAPWAAYFLALQLAGSFADTAIARGVRIVTVRRLATAGGLVGAALCLVLLRSVESANVALALVCLAAFAIGFAASGVTAVPLDLSPRHAPVLIGFSNTIASIPGIAGVAMTGFLVDLTHSYAAAFVMSSLVGVSGAVLFIVLASDRPLEGPESAR